jgi:DNA protecting protein DprA
VKGNLAPQPEKSVAVIGTREPTAHGELIARRIAKFFAEQGWSIVSGLAIGCDALAHKAALEHGAHTVAVLAHGLQTIAPSRHKGLAQEILDSGGALITEYRYGQGIQKQQYVKRDRIQAGIAQGVVMVQSDLVGGSLHASRASVEYGRWLAVPIATDRDREYGEPKVQANLLLANGDDRERSSLLRCSTQDLRRVFILRSRDDYVQLLTNAPVAVTSSKPAASPENAEFELEQSLPAEAEMLARALLARYQYIRAKIGEVETLQQCLSDPTTSLTSYDLDHELETVLHHLDRFAVQLAAKAEAPVKESARQLREEIATLNKLLGPAIHQQIPLSTLTTVFTLFRALAELAFKEPELAQHLGSRAV